MNQYGIPDKYYNSIKTDKNDEIEIWIGFLETTDHIPNKLIESQVLGTTIGDYTELLQLRQHARDRINELK